MITLPPLTLKFEVLSEVLSSAQPQGLELFLDPRTSKRDNFGVHPGVESICSLFQRQTS